MDDTSPAPSIGAGLGPARTMLYHVWTMGCQMNAADSQRLASDLEAIGCRWTPDPLQATVVVLNTCVVRQQAEDKACARLAALRPWKARNPEAVLAVMGCIVGRNQEQRLAERFPYVDVFLPPSDHSRLVALLAARVPTAATRPAPSDGCAPEAVREAARGARLVLPSNQQGRLVTAHVPVVLGCSHACSYCIVPSRRGPERSRPATDVLAHVASLAEQGVREVTLLGQIVDRYGHDSGEPDGLADLLTSLHAVEGIERIRFLTSHPAHVSDRLIEAIAELPKVMEHLHIPVQSGDDTVLARMRRGYGADDYRRLVGRVRSRVPDVAVHTDVIVGFPGESGSQFQATYDLLAELRLDKAHIARYSPRPGTVSAVTMADDVPEDEKEHRRRALDGLQEHICSEINAGFLGRTVEVLVEDGAEGRWRGRTRNDKLVFFDDPRPRLGRLVDVRVTWAGPWSMVGEAVDASAPSPPEPPVV